MRQGQTLTPELYMMKLLLGAVDRSYDKKDEQAGAGGNYGGAPPQQGYGAPPQGYGAPPPGQYGGAPPPQGGYPGQAPGYGQPPPQQGYPQQGYPPQGGAGGYGQNPRY